MAIRKNTLDLGVQLIKPFQEFFHNHRDTMKPLFRAINANSEEQRRKEIVPACSAMRPLFTTDDWQQLEFIVAKYLKLDYAPTMGVVWGGKVSYVLGLDGITGLLASHDDREIFLYENEGVSIGVQEGGIVGAGLLVAYEKASDFAWEYFIEVGADLGIGVNLTGFTDSPFGSQTGLILMITTGEELEVSVGVGYSWLTGICRLDK